MFNENTAKLLTHIVEQMHRHLAVTFDVLAKSAD